MGNNSLKVAVIAGCVIKKDGKFLLVQEKKEIAYGLWNLPAGHVEEGETLIDAAIREAKEETGYDVEFVKDLGVRHEEAEKGVKHVYEMNIVGGELSFPKEELLDAKWFSYEEILSMKEKGQLRNEGWVLGSIEKVHGSQEA